MSEIESPTELPALSTYLRRVVEHGTRINDKLEVLHQVVTIRAIDWSELTAFCSVYCSLVGTEYWDRASQLYCTDDSLSWKASYRGRLTGASQDSEENQLERIARRLARLPGANTLSAAFFRPRDHRRAEVIAASFPCPLAIDWKYRAGHLHMSVFFRTQDAFRLGFPDIYYMRCLQRDVLRRAQEMSPKSNLEQGELGRLTFFLSRAFIRYKDRYAATELAELADRNRAAE